MQTNNNQSGKVEIQSVGLPRNKSQSTQTWFEPAPLVSGMLKRVTNANHANII